MLYETYQAHSDFFGPVRWMAGATKGLLNQPWPVIAHHPVVRSAAAACELVARAGMWHERPDFGIRGTVVDGERGRRCEEVVALHHPFCSLLHFKKDTARSTAARAAGGAALRPFLDPAARHGRDACCPITTSTSPTGSMRGTCRCSTAASISTTTSTSSPASSASSVRSTHVIAVCQPSVPVLAAVALLAADNDPAQPRTMTLMGGPIDTRVQSRPSLNRLATSRSLAWFERNVIATVPARYAGALPPRLSRLPAARRVHDHEPRPPHHRACRPLQAPRARRRRKRRGDAQNSTTSTCR